MDSDNTSFHWAETASFLYLILPLFLFFAFFVRLTLAVPACALIISLGSELVRRTAWDGIRSERRQSAYFLFLAYVWIWLAGGIGPLPLSQNGDWSKHNLVIMLLAQHPWPASVDLPHFGHLYLRYYIGWHLVPALMVKLSHSQSPTVAVSIWTTLGVFLFFSLLPDILNKRAAIIAAPLAFIFFGGADIVGTAITHFEELPLYHFEWWAGWAQFSSNTTAVFWSPQQALPAWLAIAILMRCRQRPALLPFGVLLTSATLLWSPFATIGAVPYYFVLYLHYGLRKVILGWRPVSSLLLLALPVGLYLISSTAAVPHGFIWVQPCTGGGPCFTWPAYFVFLVIEVGAPLIILLFRRRAEEGFLVAAATTLCLIPLYKMGIANDFAMRASLPSLAVLAILCARLFADPAPWPTAALAVLLLALPSVTGELIRGFLVSQPPAIDLQAADAPMRWWIAQTFAPPPIWVLR